MYSVCDLSVADPTIRFEKNHGVHRLLQQFRALLQKRLLHSWRNKVVTAVQFLLPLAFTIVGCQVTKSFPGPRDPASLNLALTMFDKPTVPYSTNSTTPSDTAWKLAVQYENIMDRVAGSVVKVNDDPKYSDNPDLQAYLIEVGEDKFSKFVNHYMVAAAFYGNRSGMPGLSADIVGLFNNEAYHTPAITLNNVNNVLLQYFAGDEKSIQVANHPLPLSTSSRVSEETSTGAVTAGILSYNLFFGMSFLIGSFVLFIVKERATKAKHIQFVSGVHITTYWASSFLWDLINFMGPSLIVLIVFAAFDIKPYYEGENAGYGFLINMPLST